MRRFLLGAALLFGALAVAGFVWVLRTPWSPQTSFDIIGILWLFENLPKMFVFVLAVLLSALSVYLLLKARALGGTDGPFDLDGEGLRILQDPRFHGIVRPHAQRNLSAQPPAPPDASSADPSGSPSGETPP